MIQFDCAVNYNGKYYPANTPIEEPAKKATKAQQESDPVNGEETPVDKPEPAKKATKARKKGDA